MYSTDDTQGGDSSLDVHSAEVAINNLLDLARDTLDSESKMYKKSKDRWRRIQLTCLEISEVISSMLEEDYLDEDTDDSNASVMQTLQSMQSQIDKLRVFVGEPVKSTNSKEEEITLSSEERKSIISRYRSTFTEAHDFTTLEAEQCNQLLLDWFVTKFIHRDPLFKYNIRRITEWVYDIVIVYSKHIESGTADTFVREFREWLLDPSNTSYAVPLEIYQCDRQRGCGYWNTTSLVIYDMLLDAGYANLTSGFDFALSDDEVYNRCKSSNPECLDMYVNYKTNPVIIDSLHLTRIGGDKK